MRAQIVAVTMPKWGMEMREGEVVAWHAAVGDPVAAGADLVDVETSKIVNTVVAPVSGVLRAIVAEPGETLPVGALLGVIAPADVAEEEIRAFVARTAASGIPDAAGGEGAPDDAHRPAPGPEPETAPPAAVQGADAPPPSAAGGEVSAGDGEVAASPVARRLARRYGLVLAGLSGTGRHGRISKADVEAALRARGVALPEPPPRRPGLPRRRGDEAAVAATPVARRLARKLGVSLLDCRPSGARGRVCKADVEAAAARAGIGLAAPGAPAPAATAEKTPMGEPLRGMRRTIAARLQAAKREAPHFRVAVAVELDHLLALKRDLEARLPEARLSLNDCIVKAVGAALVRVPEVNVRFEEERLVRLAEADVAVAVALPDGLVTPVVRSVQAKGLVALADELRDLVTRARLGTLKPEETQGGGFTVSNLGMYGVDRFDAIINPPQGAILAVGAAKRRPVVRGDDLAVATVAEFTLSCDHRVIDGAVAARFLDALRGFLEHPATMLG
ncbi:MAG: dihydrolipoamide acetyltransferase component of pyruvate dehydrogenase complex [Porticoccaceae bacterium]|nr:MAG: dihydrolipoamide acetyltransferase component of pyruvate dehydrogenase complex [Porticoccaceae bacterium]